MASAKKLEGKLQQLYAHGNEQAKKEIDDFLELAFGERVWPGVTLTLPPIGAGLCWIMDPIIWQVMVGFADETKWPTRTVRPAMECTNETTEFMVSRPGPNIRPLQITPAHGRHVSDVLSELAFILSELAFVERWGRHAGDRDRKST